MAEGVLEGLLGTGEGEEFVGPDGSGPSLDAAAAAAAMNDAKDNPDLARDAAEYFRKQARLVEIQTEHLHEQRAVQLSSLKLKQASDRLRVGLQLFIALAATAVALTVVFMVWGAVHDRGLVVEGFSVPPELAQQGLTGEVVAKEILDRLSELQAQSETMRRADSFRNNWGEQLKVEIPETGVSMGELQRYLDDRLGHETHISGELYRSTAGLTIRARAGEEGAKSFSGPDTDLDHLLDEAAEAVYAKTQPYRYGIYLFRHARAAEARTVFAELAQSPDDNERAWAHVGLGMLETGADGDPRIYAQEERAALSYKPGFAPALLLLSLAEGELGHDQESLRQADAYLRARPSIRRDIAPDLQSGATAYAVYQRDIVTGDYSDAVLQARRLRAMAPKLARAIGDSELAPALVLDHDQAIQEALSQVPITSPRRWRLLGILALGEGDPAAVALLSRAEALATSAGGQDLASRTVAPWLAIAKAEFGDAAGAESALEGAPADCDLCTRARGLAAAARRDRKSADRWFAQAIQDGPDLPQAYTDRGGTRLQWGDLKGALADAVQAQRLSPHDPDALKLLGDVLARQRNWRAALSAYDEALSYAPGWRGLRRARDLALASVKRS